ncbi:MAG: LacI family DNA-binding transcriptional regulator [Armatimonadetes bacterium]|nr:LacI family DNA-binding transcriptional regulator [Armatimonadota bacterium]
MPVSIREVAARAGVSLGTVSKVLNDSIGAQIAAGTRDRVRVAARELGYYPSAVARALVRQRTDTLGVIFPQFNSESPIRGGFFSLVFNEILESAHVRKQDVTILSGRSWVDSPTSLPMFRDGRCDGYFVFFQHDDSDLLTAFASVNLPFVLVNDCRDDERIACVDVDNRDSGRRATQFLLQMGHQRIAHLPGNLPHAPVEGRLQGYRDALEEAGIAFDTRFAPPGDYFFDSVTERVTNLMALPPGERPTALFCGSDGIASNALRALGRLGLRVPEDVSVLGHDDLPDAAQEHPPLTTMRQPFPAIGKAVVDELLAIIAKTATPGRKQLLPTQLVVRQSVAPPV